MEEIIKTILFDWAERDLPNFIDRDLDLEKYITGTPIRILALTGFRRVGKTYIVLHQISKLLQSFTRKQVIYINFEDERIPHNPDFLTQLVPVIKKTFGSEPAFLFLDEIHQMPLWSKWLRRMQETTKIRFVITGSNSKMSTVEIPTELRGRYIEIKVHPLNFKEFLRFNNFETTIENIEYRESDKAQLDNLLNAFLKNGGLPEIVQTESFLKTEIAQSYFRTVVSRDIIERFGVRNVTALNTLLKMLLNARTFTISKLHNNLKSIGIDTGKATVDEYLEYAESVYFFDYITCYSFKLIEALKTPRKVYCVDNSFITAIAQKTTSELGAMYELAVFHSLTYNNESLHYWKSKQNNYECDFVVVNHNKVTQLVQVSYDVTNNDTLQREIRGLLHASNELNCKNLYIINNNISKIDNYDWFGIKRKIEFVPLWKWLLEITPQ